MNQSKCIQNAVIMFAQGRLEHFEHLRTLYGEKLETLEVINEKTAQPIYNEFLKKHGSWWIEIDILNVIILNIEKIDLEDQETIEAIKNKIKIACEISKIDERKGIIGISKEDKNIISQKMINEVVMYCSTITLEEALTIPIGYSKRVLKKEEKESIGRELHDKCKFYGERCKYVWPIEAKFFRTNFDEASIVKILETHKISTLYQIQYDIDAGSYELELKAFNLLKGSFEALWTSKEKSWAILKSHEDCYFIYGEWLMKAMLDKKPNMLNYIYDQV